MLVAIVWRHKRKTGPESPVYKLILSFMSDPGRIRTPNPQSRNLIFYPVELLGQARDQKYI
jgi:hypothetical protein